MPAFRKSAHWWKLRVQVVVGVLAVVSHDNGEPAKARPNHIADEAIRKM
jgi:hypothetical protein